MEEYKEIQTTNNETKPKETSPVVGFWPFFGMLLLFAIPVIGLVAAIVFLFAFKNKNIKNFAGASLALIVVRLIASVLLLSVLLSSFLGVFLPMINENFGTEFNDLKQVLSLVTDLKKGNYSSAVSSFVPGLTKILGEEYTAFFTELSSGKYEDLLHQLDNEQYALILSDLENGKYPQLTDTLDADSYQFITEELEKEAKGFDSEFLDEIEDLLS